VGLLSGLLFLPVAGPLRGLQFIAEQIKAQADAELLDEGRVEAELMELSVRFDLGEISEEDYAAQETALLERLDEIRALKEGLYEPDPDVEEGDS
jgi:hypothetical protein